MVTCIITEMTLRKLLKYYYERTLEIQMIWKKESIIIIELDAKHFQLMLLTLTTCLQSIMINNGGNLGGAGGRPPPPTQIGCLGINFPFVI